MDISKIIEVASKAYDPDEPDMVVLAAKGENVGDTLARFIAIELKETYDETSSDAEQLAMAVRTLERAALRLNNVVAALENVE